MIQGEAVYGGTVVGCSQFQSRDDAGAAEIRANVSWTNDGDSVSVTKTGPVDCYLLEYDQGWAAEACIDPNPTVGDGR